MLTDNALAFGFLQVVPGEEDAELTSLAWTQDVSSQEQRLFASRLDGQLYEVDFSSLKSSHSSDSHGGAVWCTAAEPLAAVQEDSSQRLAVGEQPGEDHMVPGMCVPGRTYSIKQQHRQPWMQLQEQ